MTDVAERYLELGLRLGRHIDGLVDAYYGPAEIKERVDGEELRSPADLAGNAVALLAEIDGDRNWLRAQLTGLETVARRLAGEEISYVEEVERCYGIAPERVPEERFEAVHETLDETLPGDGSLAERFQVWRDTNTLSGDQLARVIDSLGADLRDRTERLLGLPEGEAVQFDYVTDEPWAAYNYYLGGLRSRVAVNTDTPLTPTFLIGLVSHETYPGHHTEHAWKERVLVEEGGVLEESIFLIGTPQSLVSEGIGSLAPEMVLGEDEQQVAAEHVRDTGVEFDPELSQTLHEAARPLGGVGTNVALMLHEEGRSQDEAFAYLKRWGLRSDRRAKQAIRFMTDPVWRSYTTTYSDGYRICKAFVAGDPARFKRLLTEQLTPADIVAAT